MDRRNDKAEKCDGDQYKELKKLIDKLTHTGEKTLDKVVLKCVTKICKLSNTYVIHSYHLLMEHLAAKHSEIRFSAFQICMELFKRSHCFRELLVANLQQVMEWTADTNPANPMPLPRSTAIMLKKLSLSSIREWAKEYGKAYKKLHLSISFLKQCKKVDFNAMTQEEAAEQSHRDELARRRKALHNEHFQKVLSEIKEVQPDIINSITEMENCIALLLPKPEDLFIDQDPPEDINTEASTSERVIERSLSTTTFSDSTDDDYSLARDRVFDFRKYGILNPQFSITLNLNLEGCYVVKKTEENAPIIDNARDLFKLLCNRYLPYIEKWETVIKKCSELDQMVTGDTLNKVTDLRERLNHTLKKYRHLNLEAPQSSEDAGDTSDSDFEEVENKEGYEAYSKAAAVAVNAKAQESSKASKIHNIKKDWSLVSDENNEKDPTSALSTLSSLSRSKPATVTKADLNESFSSVCDEPDHPSKVEALLNDSSQSDEPKQNSTLGEETLDTKAEGVSSAVDSEMIPGTSSGLVRKAKLLAVAPKLPFDVDLYHWEDEKIEAPTRLTTKPDGHHFWVSTAEDRDELRDPDGEASLRTRVIEFTGDFQPVDWACRAPLPSGKLCPRKDRVKCPFHGKIVGRDKLGKPTNPADQKAEEERLNLEKAKEIPDWQDPKLLAELKESTGVDLRMPDKSKRGWRKHVPGQEEKKYAGLTNLKASQNTVYNRLSRKVFKKSAMKRVAADMDKLDRKRFRDKYGDQFNYVFDHT